MLVLNLDSHSKNEENFGSKDAENDRFSENEAGTMLPTYLRMRKIERLHVTTNKIC